MVQSPHQRKSFSPTENISPESPAMSLLQTIVQCEITEILPTKYCTCCCYNTVGMSFWESLVINHIALTQLYNASELVS